MGIEILTKNISSGETIHFIFQDNIKQYFLGISKITIWNSQDEDPKPVSGLSAFVNPLSVSGKVLTVKFDIIPKDGRGGLSYGSVTVLALTGVNDEEFLMASSLRHGQTVNLPGTPSILIPALSGFDAAFHDGTAHHIHTFGMTTAAVKEMSDVAMMSSQAILYDATGHHSSPSSYALGSILAYTGMSETIKCTSYICTDQQPHYILPSLSDHFGVFISSFSMNFPPGTDHPIWDLIFDASAGKDPFTGDAAIGCFAMLNPHYGESETFFQASVNLVEILGTEPSVNRNAREILPQQEERGR